MSDFQALLSCSDRRLLDSVSATYPTPAAHVCLVKAHLPFDDSSRIIQEFDHAIYVSFVHLMDDPRIRVSVPVVTPMGPGRVVRESIDERPRFVSLDFHWASLDDKRGPGIKSFRQNRLANGDYTIEFETYGATRQTGFNLFERSKQTDAAKSFTHWPYVKIIEYLQTLVDPTKPQTVSLRLLIGRSSDSESDSDHGYDSDNSSHVVARILRHLPGGPSNVPKLGIGSKSWPQYRNSAGEIRAQASTSMHGLKLKSQSAPRRSFARDAPNDTFADASEIQCQLGYSTNFEFDQEKQQLLSFSKVRHCIVLVRMSVSTLALVRYEKFPIIGAGQGLRVAPGTRTRLKFAYPGFEAGLEVNGRVIDHYSLKEAATYNVVVLIDELPRSKIDRSQLSCLDDFNKNTVEHIFSDVHFQPNHATFTAQTETLTALCKCDRNKGLVELVKNQDHSKLSHSDYIEASVKDGMDIKAATAIWNELVEQVSSRFNASQMASLKAVRNLRERIQLVSGFTGTGKTELLLHHVKVALRLRNKVMFLAPTNTNVDDFTSRLNAMLEALDLDKLPVIVRLPSPAAEQEFRKAHRGGEQTSQREQFDGTRLVQHELLQEARSQNFAKMSRSQHLHPTSIALAQAQLSRNERWLEVIEQYHMIPSNSSSRKMVSVGEFVDMVEELGRFFMRSRSEPVHKWADVQGTIDDEQMSDADKYEYALDRCELAVMRHADLVLATTASSSSALTREWAPGDSKVLLLMDEAMKDRTLNLLMPLVQRPGLPTYSSKLAACIMVGDEKQLEPIVTTRTTDGGISAFQSRLGVSLATSLIREGFPVTYLTEQHRCHKDIVAFSSSEFYDGKLQTASVPHLQEQNFSDVKLRDALKAFYKPEPSHEPFGLPDRLLRSVLVVINGGKVRYNPNSKSRVVLEQVRFVVARLPSLLEHYGDQTRDKVVILCIYAETAKVLKAELTKLRFASRSSMAPLTEKHLPEVSTVDAFQGSQREVGIIITALGDDCGRRVNLGFISDWRRLNIALTRMQKARIIVAGRCDGARTDHKIAVLKLVAEHFPSRSVEFDARDFAMEVPPHLA